VSSSSGSNNSSTSGSKVVVVVIPTTTTNSTFATTVPLLGLGGENQVLFKLKFRLTRVCSLMAIITAVFSYVDLSFNHLVQL
jgi:hypothetical protein